MAAGKASQAHDAPCDQRAALQLVAQKGGWLKVERAAGGRAEA